MPRERVHHGKMFVATKTLNDGLPPTAEDSIRREFVPGETLQEGELIFEEPSLDIHWNRDGEYVQISLDAPTDWWRNFVASRDGDDRVTAFGAFTDRLTRKEINDMIKTLRRARDAAYGSDE